ncbi:MAG: ribbon-helix-helix domain-containing protein [Aeromicrobium sp.]
MTIQIAVRLPDDLVEFIDRVVADGVESSRAAVVAKAIERERRRESAMKDAQILANSTAPDDLDGLATYAAGVHLGLD